MNIENYKFLSKNCLIADSGWAPMNSSATFPSLKSFTEGIDITENFCACF